MTSSQPDGLVTSEHAPSSPSRSVPLEQPLNPDFMRDDIFTILNGYWPNIGEANDQFAEWLFSLESEQLRFVASELFRKICEMRQTLESREKSVKTASKDASTSAIMLDTSSDGFEIVKGKVEDASNVESPRTTRKLDMWDDPDSWPVMHRNIIAFDKLPRYPYYTVTRPHGAPRDVSIAACSYCCLRDKRQSRKADLS